MSIVAEIAWLACTKAVSSTPKRKKRLKGKACPSACIPPVFPGAFPGYGIRSPHANLASMPACASFSAPHSGTHQSAMCSTFTPFGASSQGLESSQARPCRSQAGDQDKTLEDDRGQ